MLFPKFILLTYFALVVLQLLQANLTSLSERFQRYMIDNARRAPLGDGTGSEWQRPWWPLLCKAIIVFVACMIIVGAFVVLFSE